jgi:hypothetical protein
MKNAISTSNSVITSKIGRFRLKSTLSKDGDDKDCDAS